MPAIPSASSFALTVYVLAWAQLLAVIYALSLAHRLTRPGLLLALAAFGGVGFLVWAGLGRPIPPVATWRAQLSTVTADPIVRVLGVAIVVMYAYTLALAVFTAANDGDPLVYELTRAALWRQQHAVGWLGAAYQPALDVWPPHAEMATAATMILSDSDRFVALGQFVSVFALSTAVAGIGARVGLQRRDAAFGALLVPFVPVVLAQSWTGYTDLVFASFLVAGAYFSLGSRTAELVPFGSAAGLALGTKYLGPILLPRLILVVVAQPARRLAAFGLAGLAGVGLGAIWFVHNALHTADAHGGVGRSGFQPHAWRPILGSINRYLTELFDLSGAGGTGVLTGLGGTGVLVYPLRQDWSWSSRAPGVAAAQARDGRWSTQGSSSRSCPSSSRWRIASWRGSPKACGGSRGTSCSSTGSSTPVFSPSMAPDRGSGPLRPCLPSRCFRSRCGPFAGVRSTRRGSCSQAHLSSRSPPSQ